MGWLSIETSLEIQVEKLVNIRMARVPHQSTTIAEILNSFQFFGPFRRPV
jgi:hypothetical protein